MRFSGPHMAARTTPAYDTRPAKAIGTAVDDGASGAYGTYEAIGSAISTDVYGVWINITAAETAGASNPAVMTIGRDEAGGTSFTDWIPDLLVKNASELTTLTAPAGGTGIWYFFPLFAKAGTTFGAKVKTTTAAGSTWSTTLYFLSAVDHPEWWRTGQSVTAFGITAQSGVAVTPGNAAEGTWTEIGTLAADYFFWQFGYMFDDTTGSLNMSYIDLAVGDATNKRVIFQNHRVHQSGNEALAKTLSNPWECFAHAKSGEKLYARIHCSSAGDTGVAIAIYGVR